jgi:hypothetical protein
MTDSPDPYFEATSRIAGNSTVAPREVFVILPGDTRFSNADARRACLRLIADDGLFGAFLDYGPGCCQGRMVSLLVSRTPLSFFRRCGYWFRYRPNYTCSC